MLVKKLHCLSNFLCHTVFNQFFRGSFLIKIKKGLTIPISGQPSLQFEQAQSVRSVGLVGPNYVGMKPTMIVKEGESVKIGQKLFECKKNPGLFFTSPAAGKISHIIRGERRVFQTVEIQVQADAYHDFSTYQKKAPTAYELSELRALLQESGLWTGFRERPFDKIPLVDSNPHSIFVSTIDTQPLSIAPSFIISERKEDFQLGLSVISKLASKNLYICGDIESLDLPKLPNLKSVKVSGLHPAGNVGTHIHFLEPVSLQKSVWHIGYQDVIAIGYLFKTGKLDVSRVFALGGPRAKNPRVLKTRLGANLEDLLEGEVVSPEETRVISGSILNGRTKDKVFKFLGQYDNLVSCIEEDNSRSLLGWHSPGFNLFSQKRIYFSKLMPKKIFSLGSSTHGSARAMVPTGSFEEITPLDILPTQLLRALLSYDTDQAQELGCLDLAEEDLALYTFVSPGKIDFGPVLRENLSKIEKEG